MHLRANRPQRSMNSFGERAKKILAPSVLPAGLPDGKSLYAMGNAYSPQLPKGLVGQLVLLPAVGHCPTSAALYPLYSFRFWSLTGCVASTDFEHFRRPVEVLEGF